MNDNVATMKKPRKAHTKVTQKKIQQMLELEKEGFNQSQIAELVGLSQSCVSRHLKNAKPMKTHLTPKERQQIVLMKKEGKTSKYIAGKMHRGLSTVDKVWAAYRNGDAEFKKAVDFTIKNKIHRKGNELHNVDVHEPTAENDVPMVHPEKVETTNAVLWLMITAVVFILGMAIANV